VPLHIVHWLALIYHRITLHFYKKHPKRTGAALGIAGGILLAPVAAVTALGALGFTSAGIAAGNVVFYHPKGWDFEFQSR
jgi:hypothetical protein